MDLKIPVALKNLEVLLPQVKRLRRPEYLVASSLFFMRREVKAVSRTPNESAHGAAAVASHTALFTSQIQASDRHGLACRHLEISPTAHSDVDTAELRLSP